MAQADVDRISKTPLYFVIGKERSGTTLLQVMLNSHPNIIAPPESKFIMNMQLRYAGITLWTEENIKDFCNEMYTEKLFREFWDIDKEKLYHSLVEVKEKLNYPLLCKLVFWQFSCYKDCELFIDKNPAYYSHLHQLTKLFPDAKFIHIVREYHANIYSKSLINRSNFSFADIAYRWMKVNREIEKIKSKSQSKWFTLRYEMLVNEPELAMEQICSFVNLPFNKNMTKEHYNKVFPSFYKKDTQGNFGKYHKKVFSPINNSFNEEWKDGMSEKDKSIVEYIAGAFAEKQYGYKKESGNASFRVSIFRMWFIKVKFAASRVYYGKLLKRRWMFYIHQFIMKHKKKKKAMHE